LTDKWFEGHQNKFKSLRDQKLTHLDVAKAGQKYELKKAPGPLNLPGDDYGIDGIYRNEIGGFDAINASSKQVGQTLLWQQLSTFVGLADSDKIDNKVIFTNCEEIVPVLNDRIGFCIRGSALDLLSRMISRQSKPGSTSLLLSPLRNNRAPIKRKRSWRSIRRW
jgi:hypothetical protein